MDHSVHKITVYRIVSIALLIVLALLMLFPLYWIITGSVKGAREINARVPSFFPVSPTMANYAKLFSKPAWTWLLNTVFICGMTMLLACLCGAMGGYALAKKQFAGRGLIFTMFVCAMALPKQVIMIPLLKEMAWLNLHNTLWAVIFPTVGWPFGVFLMKQFYEGVPTELCEAARIDGLSEYGIWWHIMLPLSLPALSTLTIFTFVNTWNDFLGPLIYLTKTELKTIQIGLRMFITQYSAEYGLIMAASVVALIPVLIVFLSLQKYFVQGVASTGIKG